MLILTSCPPMKIIRHSSSFSCMLDAPPISPSLMFMKVYAKESIHLELAGQPYGSLSTMAHACTCTSVSFSQLEATWLMLTWATQRQPLICLWFWPVKCNWWIHRWFSIREFTGVSNRAANQTWRTKRSYPQIADRSLLNQFQGATKFYCDLVQHNCENTSSQCGHLRRHIVGWSIALTSTFRLRDK